MTIDVQKFYSKSYNNNAQMCICVDVFYKIELVTFTFLIYISVSDVSSVCLC